MCSFTGVVKYGVWEPTNYTIYIVRACSDWDMKMTTGLHVRPSLRMSGAKPPLLLYVSRQTQGKLNFLTTIMYLAVLLVRLRKCDSGLVQTLHQTHAVLLAGSNMTLSSCSNWFLSCIYKLVMTMIILAPTP